MPPRGHPTISSAPGFRCTLPSFHTFLSNLSKRSDSNYELWAFLVLFFFLEQQVTKGSLSFFVNKNVSQTCVTTKVALEPAGLCQLEEPL